MRTRVGETVIGRAHPAALLRAEIDRVTESHGGLVLITGEAGIGKTTLVTAAAEDARARGVTVVGGRCWDSQSAPSYWPWVQVMRGLRRHASPDEWAEIEEAGATGLAVLLGRAAQSQEQTDTFTLYDGITAALVAASQQAPVLAVIDDLHWADPASLRLLEFAARHTWFERLLLVGTYRDVEVEPAPGHPLRGLMLPLVAKATTVTLTGLDPPEVGALIARTAGREPSAELVAEVHRRTGGNPFFVEQTARLWRVDGSVAAIPPGVREAVRRRLDLLPASLVELLTTASVLGHDFHRQLLAAAVGAPVAEVDRLLDEAIAGRLVVGRGGGRFAFGHDLVRETLYDALSEEDRRGRHAAVVRAVERVPELRGRLFPADLARHAYAAGPAVAASVAVDHLLVAGRDASARLAPEEAVGHFRRALERAEDPAGEVTVRLDLARELAHGSGRDAAWDQIDAAAAAARRVADPAALARVALVADRHRGPRSSKAPAVEALLREAHQRFVGGPAGELSREELVRAIIARVEVQARSRQDDEQLAFSLWSRHDAIWGLGSAREREALMSELEAVARRSGDLRNAAFAASLRWVALLELGDPRYYDMLQTFGALVEQVDVAQARLASSIDRGIIAALRGEFAEAAALQDETASYIDADHADQGYMGQHLRWALLMQRGRFAEAAALVAHPPERHEPYHTLVAALTAAAQGDPGPGRRHIAEADTPHPRAMEPLFIRLIAEVAALTGDPSLCARARAALTPYRGEWLVSLYGCDVSGPVDLWLATVDAAESDWVSAAAGFTAARAAADRLSARPWSLVARLGLARARRALGQPAADLLAEVHREATALGMPHVAAEAARLSAAPPPATTGSPPATHRNDPAALPTDAPNAPATTAATDHHGPALLTDASGVTAPKDGDPASNRHQPATLSTETSTSLVRPGGDPARGGSADLAAAEGGGQSLNGPDAAAGGGGPRARSVADGHAAGEFRRDGDVWRLGFAGRVVHMPDAKGLRDLRELLRRPGDDIPAVALLDPAAGPELVAARRMGGDPVLDDEAKARYRRHLEYLDEAIDTAAERGDKARVAALDDERRALITELRAAAGLAGRTRRLGDEAERARKTVTARIRDTLRKIDDRHPELATHLRAAVSTGAMCRYTPTEAVTWHL